MCVARYVTVALLRTEPLGKGAASVFLLGSARQWDCRSKLFAVFFSGEAFPIILFFWLRAFFWALLVENGGVLLGWSMI